MYACAVFPPPDEVGLRVLTFETIAPGRLAIIPATHAVRKGHNAWMNALGGEDRSDQGTEG